MRPPAGCPRPAGPPALPDVPPLTRERPLTVPAASERPARAAARRRTPPCRHPLAWAIAGLGAVAALPAWGQAGGAPADAPAPSSAASAAGPLPAAEAPLPPAGSGLRRPLSTDLACVPVDTSSPRSRRAAAAPTPAGPRGSVPLGFEADRLEGRLDQRLTLEGNVQLRQAPLRLGAQRVEYDVTRDFLRAEGEVEVERGGDVYRGPRLELELQRMSGHFLSPRFEFARTQTGGSAARLDFLDEDRVNVTGARYSGCRPDPIAVDAQGRARLDWVLEADRLRLDFGANEGIAEGAVLRFLDVPILAMPVLSFPLTSARKSGWLPPGIDVANTSGLEVAVPYYWNIAPQFDATLTPVVSSKRGAGLDTEFRYLTGPQARGETHLFALPRDEVAGTARWAARWLQEGQIGQDGHYAWRTQRVSDDAYWQDGLRGTDSLFPRLLGSEAWVQRRTGGWDARGDGGETVLYARAQTWQSLQESSSPFDAPYRRAPQVGLRHDGAGHGFEWSLTLEGNRFTHADPTKLQGSRAHAIGSLALPVGDDGWRLTPRLGLNAAAYATESAMSDGRLRAHRVIPSFSLDSAWTFERPTAAFGRALTQTLEPRLLYLRTGYRDQSSLPNFDAGINDFNAVSVFADRSFSGIDRVADADQITAGLTTRFLDATTGAEAARLGVAQRYLLRDQRITADGQPLTQRFSDVLLTGATSALPSLTLEASAQYSPEVDRLVRSIASVRYSPGPFRTVNATYRLLRGTSEQMELGWQWPLNGPVGLGSTLMRWWDRDDARPAPVAGACQGTLYGVGRVDWSVRDSRISGALLGVEYDSGCWIARMVVQRQSTGASAATNRLMLQLELVGLSRLGPNPLRVLKDNIPGYQLLRDDPSTERRHSPTPLP